MTASADIIIQGYDKASQVFVKVGIAYTAMQKQIEGQSRLAGSAFASQIERQMSGQAQLRDELFRATASQKDIALRDLQVYYDDWRNQFAGNEQMMTLIAQAESAKRKKIMEEYALATTSRLTGIFRTIAGRGAGIAIGVYALTRVINSITEAREEYLKTNKTADDFILTIYKSIPVLSGYTKALEGLFNQLLGVNREMEKTARLEKAGEAFFNISDRIRYSLETLGKGPKETARIDAFREYQKTIRELQEVAKEGIIIEPLIGQAGELYGKTIEEIRAAPIREMIKNLEEQLNTLRMTRTELALSKAAREGATAAEMTAIAIKAQYLDKFDEEKKKREEQIRLIEQEKRAQQSFADSVKESIRTAIDSYDDYIHKLHEAYIAGRLTLQEYQRAQQQMYYKELVTGKGAGVGAADFRRELPGREAGFLTRWPVTGASMGYENQVVTIAKTQLKETQETNKSLKRMEQLMSRNNNTNKVELSPIGNN